MKNDDAATCNLNLGTELSVRDPAFFDDAGLAFWKQFTSTKSSWHGP